MKRTSIILAAVWLLGMLVIPAGAAELTVAGKSAVLMDVTTGALRGMGASFVPMVICILGVCVFRIGWIYTIFQLPKFHTPQCLYVSYTVSWIITFLCQMTAFLIVYRRQAKEEPCICR